VCVCGRVCVCCGGERLRRVPLAARPQRARGCLQGRQLLSRGRACGGAAAASASARRQLDRPSAAALAAAAAAAATAAGVNAAAGALDFCFLEAFDRDCDAMWCVACSARVRARVVLCVVSVVGAVCAGEGAGRVHGGEAPPAVL
jgi:hypothetical protein